MLSRNPEDPAMPIERFYDDLVMDHIRNARNFRALPDAHRTTGANPLCGDEITLYLRLERGRIDDIAFQCTCCGISMASASIMTEAVRGLAAIDASALLREFVARLDARADPAASGVGDGVRALLATVQSFPARTRCAALPWTTLQSALNQSGAAGAATPSFSG